MTNQPVAVGVDGSEPSMAAVQWAAAEAASRQVPLRIVHAQVWRGSNEQFTIGVSAQEDWAQDRVRAAWRKASKQHPDLEITGDVTAEAPAKVLLDALHDAELLVLGSRGVGMVAGFLTGSVALPVVAHATAPVVLIREEQRQETEDEDAASRRPVVVGLDLQHRSDPVLEFALEAAARTGRRLRVVHVWPKASVHAYPSALPDPQVGADLEADARKRLDSAVTAWREPFPDVRIGGSPAARCCGRRAPRRRGAPVAEAPEGGHVHRSGDACADAPLRRTCRRRPALLRAGLGEDHAASHSQGHDDPGRGHRPV
jgi:nucleotide-binding universal stress UspA family protein